MSNEPKLKTAEEVQDEYAESKGYENYYCLIIDDKKAVSDHTRNVQELYAKPLKSHITELEAEIDSLRISNALGKIITDALDAENKKLTRVLRKIKNTKYITGICGVDDCMYDKQVCTLRDIAEQALK